MQAGYLHALIKQMIVHWQVMGHWRAISKLLKIDLITQSCCIWAKQPKVRYPTKPSECKNICPSIPNNMSVHELFMTYLWQYTHTHNCNVRIAQISSKAATYFQYQRPRHFLHFFCREKCSASVTRGIPPFGGLGHIILCLTIIPSVPEGTKKIIKSCGLQAFTHGIRW